MTPTPKLIIAIAAAATLAACSSKSGDPALNHEVLRSEKARITTPRIDPTKLATQTQANNAFAADLYGKLVGTAPGDNHFYSPHSISTALAMLYAGARGETATEMRTALRFELGEADLHPAFNKLDLELSSRGQGKKAADGGDFRLNVANALWGQTGHPFVPAFIDLLGVNYGAGMHLLDYKTEPERARGTINEWVEGRTEGRIKDLMPPGSITEGTRLVLTNAIYFNAAWQTPFDKSATRPSPFRAPTGEISVPMMSALQERASHAAGEGYQAAELPYDGGELSMVVILPDDLPAFEKGLDGARLKQVVDGLIPQSVRLTMPTLEVETKYDEMATQLKALGMNKAFQMGGADFTGIDDGAGLLYVSKVVHKAFCKINEKGTEAAAATGIAMDAGVSIPADPVVMTVDRPYLFIIRDRATGAFLFVGRVVDPS